MCTPKNILVCAARPYWLRHLRRPTERRAPPQSPASGSPAQNAQSEIGRGKSKSQSSCSCCYMSTCGVFQCAAAVLGCLSQVLCHVKHVRTYTYSFTTMEHFLRKKNHHHHHHFVVHAMEQTIFHSMLDACR